MPHRMRKPLVRELDAVLVRGRALIARVRHDGIELKRKGERWPTGYFVPWLSVYNAGARLRAIENARERAARRAARRGGRS